MPAQLAVKYETHDRIDEIHVNLSLSGLATPIIVTDEIFREVEAAAYAMPYNRPLTGETIVFITHLPTGHNLSSRGETRLDAAIFRGLVTRGKKGDETRFS